MARIILYCSMQENGFRQIVNKGKPCTIKECRDMFECEKAGCECRNCPCLKISGKTKKHSLAKKHQLILMSPEGRKE